MLSNSSFPEFAQQVVPYLHITTRIKDQPYDGLLGEKGGTGFPTLMFLDAEGRRLLTHRGPRSAKGFQDSLKRVQNYLRIKAEAEEGDSKAQALALIQEINLQWYDFEEATKRVRALKKVSKAQERELEQLLINTEVRTLAAKPGDSAKLQAGERFAAMLEDKRIPSNESELFTFWGLMGLHAEASGDKRLLAKILKEVDRMPSSSRQRRALKELQQRKDRL